MAFGLFALELYCLPAPDFLQIVEIAHRRMHDVHHHVAEVDEHPLAARFALDAVDAHAVLPDFLLHAVRQRLDLARRVAARDYHALEHRRHARGVEDDDVAPLDVLQRLEHHALLLAQVHLAVEPAAGDVVRHRGWHQAGQVFAARGARADVARGDRHGGKRNDSCRLVLDLEARAREHRDPRSPGDLLRLVPGVELCVLIASQDQIELRISIGPQALERVYGVTGSAGSKLARVDLVERLALDREPEHRDAVLARRDRRVAVARCSGGHPQQLVEIELAHGGARHREVRVVNRIESAAEDAYFQVRTSPWPSTTNFWVVRPSRPTGPRACSLSVEMPTSAPRPYS